MSRVPCTLPHQGEVAGTARIPDSDGPGYPGETRVRERAAALCGPVLDEYALDYWAVPDGMDEVYLYPSRGNWKSGERDVTCAYEDRDGLHRGSVRTDRAALNPAQLAYLEAARAFNSAYWEEPDAEIAEARSEYSAWARKMAEASRKEAEDLSRTSTNWPEGARPKVAELAAAQREAATAWDTAAKTTDGTALEREVRRAKSLVAKSTGLTTEIRRELGLSTGEQVGDIQV
ncbi:septum formation family protein [Kitasatospora aburaviensis]